MLHLINNIIAVDLVDFDPDIIDVVVSFFAVSGKYAFFFGILAVLLGMLIRAGTGKARFL